VEGKMNFSRRLDTTKIFVLALITIVLTTSSASAKPVYVEGKDMGEIMDNAFHKFVENAINDKPISIVCEKNMCDYSDAKSLESRPGAPIPEACCVDEYQESAYTPDAVGWNTLAKAWNVPSAPPVNAGQVLFFFDGKEDGNPLTIYQPVLDWNWGGTGRWQIASWCVGGCYAGRNWNSTFLNVDVGDTIFGSIQYSSGHWNTNAWDVQKQIATGLSISDTRPFTYENLDALESYYLTACNQFSGPVTFNPYAYAGFPPIPTLNP